MILPKLRGIEPMDDEQIAEPARRRAAQYARQPSLWPAPSSTPPSQPDRTRQGGRVVRTAVTAAVLLGGPPWLLWQVFGNPVTVGSSWWATGPFSAATTSSPADGRRVALIWAAWLAWAVLATLLAGSVAGVLRGRRLPRWRLPMPLHRIVFGLTGTATVALVTTPVTAAVASPAAQAAPAPQLEATTSVAQPGHATATPAPADEDTAEFGDAKAGGDPVTVAVEDVRYDYRVRRGDTLSRVARVWLGDPDRWPEICRLNKHRHFAGGRSLTDCDLIYPGWELRLPADAVPPPHATPSRPPRTPPRPAEPPERPHPEQSNPPATNPAPTRAADVHQRGRSPPQRCSPEEASSGAVPFQDAKWPRSATWAMSAVIVLAGARRVSCWAVSHRLRTLGGRCRR
jgi:hypothetical protein